jgi:hypothetical protein
MTLAHRSALFAVAFLACAPRIHAQAADPVGHWEGTVATPQGEFRIEFDFTKNAAGVYAGTLSQPDRQLKGFPLSAVGVDGRTLRFEVPINGGGRFHADFDAAGNALAGTFESPGGPFPFKVARAGEARITAVPKSAPVSKRLEGTWSGMLDADGGLRVVLKLANQSDGSATCTLVSVDQGGLEIPAVVVEREGAVTLDLKMVSSTYAGRLNDAGTEIAGTYKTPQGIELPLNFKR